MIKRPPQELFDTRNVILPIDKNKRCRHRNECRKINQGDVREHLNFGKKYKGDVEDNGQKEKS
jgi:hypothetical protein